MASREVQSGSNRLSNSQAAARNRHERHDRDWWRRHYSIIVLVAGGYYYLDDGYWYPASGYDSNYDYYDYDGPIYACDNLMPNQVISDVQIQLQQEGYYSGAITGSLDAMTQAAIVNYQRNHGLAITGTVDEPTVESLGFG